MPGPAVGAVTPRSAVGALGQGAGVHRQPEFRRAWTTAASVTRAAPGTGVARAARTRLVVRAAGPGTTVTVVASGAIRQRAAVGPGVVLVISSKPGEVTTVARASAQLDLARAAVVPATRPGGPPRALAGAAGRGDLDGARKAGRSYRGQMTGLDGWTSTR